MTSAELLDRVQTLTAIEAFDPTSHAPLVEQELAGDLEARDAALATALAQIETLIARVMRIRLEHAADALPAATRRVFASTIAAYADDLPLLAQRVGDAVARSRAPVAVDAVMAAARDTLALRGQLRDGVLAVIRTHARAAIADADRRARSRELEDAERKQWSAQRRELEALADDPARVGVPLAQRLAAWPEQLDEPAPEAEVSFADMIELD